MIYEYRVYEAMPGKMPALVEMMSKTVAVFERLGVKVVGYWTPTIGEPSDRFIYMLGFDSLEHRQKAWAGFGQDPEWQKFRAEVAEREGTITARTFNSILRPTSYSPAQ